MVCMTLYMYKFVYRRLHSDCSQSRLYNYCTYLHTTVLVSYPDPSMHLSHERAIHHSIWYTCVWINRLIVYSKYNSNVLGSPHPHQVGYKKLTHKISPQAP